MDSKKYDFCGWATKNNIRCSDGRMILKDAFADDDGKTVPMVYMHCHDDISNVLGHAILENRDQGVYFYGFCNDSQSGKDAKIALQHGDIRQVSIYANKLRQTKDGCVKHGVIRELSLVLGGANPGAVIEDVAHSDDESDLLFDAWINTVELNDEGKLVHSDFSDNAVIYSGEGIEFDDGSDAVEHSDKTEGDAMAEKNSETKADGDEKTVGDVINSMTDEQKNLMYALVGAAANLKSGDDDEEAEESDDAVKHNVFDEESGTTYLSSELLHDAFNTINDDAMNTGGTFRKSFLAHADDYGIQDMEMLFPNPTELNRTPQFIDRDTTWVSRVMNGVRHTAFSRIQTTFADITEDEARAKGYIKGKLKKEEVFKLLRRKTNPTVVYKKQKFDKQDIDDVTDFDVVAWVRAEMRGKLEEEVARAILIGDGRLSYDEDKIDEECVRPIYTDADLFSIKVPVTVSSTDSESERATAAIEQVIRSRKLYKGSGNPTLFTTEDFVTECLLIKDEMGHYMYDDMNKLKTRLRVNDIVTVEVMEGMSRVDSDSNTRNLLGIIVNLTDYVVGADKGYRIDTFDDFDIDYNQYKYLMETRFSGCLVKPYSALVLEQIVSD